MPSVIARLVQYCKSVGEGIFTYARQGVPLYECVLAFCFFALGLLVGSYNVTAQRLAAVEAKVAKGGCGCAAKKQAAIVAAKASAVRAAVQAHDEPTPLVPFPETTPVMED